MTDNFFISIAEATQEYSEDTLSVTSACLLYALKPKIRIICEYLSSAIKCSVESCTLPLCIVRNKRKDVTAHVIFLKYNGINTMKKYIIIAKKSLNFFLYLP